MNLFIPLFINSYLLNYFLVLFLICVFIYTLAFPQSYCYPSLYALLLKLLSYISCSFAFSILVCNGPSEYDHTGLQHPSLFELQNTMYIFISNQ